VSRLAVRRAPEAYDRRFMATMTQAYLAQTPWTRLRLGAVRDLVDPRPGDRVLDLGSASGAVSHFLSTFGCETVGVDAEPLAVETARSLFPRLEFELADVADLPFADASFDKAVAADLVEHLTEDDFSAMLAEARRVVRPGGSLSLYTPNPAHVIERLKERDLVLAQNPTHVGLRGERELRQAVEAAGLSVELSEWRPSFVPGLATVERLLGGRTALLRYRLCLRARKPVPRGDA
jgi:SAM-dependent methyltransferase